MECRDCESAIVAYVSGDLSREMEADCRTHIVECERCRGALERYAAIIEAIYGEPELTPSAMESASLARAIARVPICRPSPVRLPARAVWEFVGFALASITAFTGIAVVLAMQVLGRIDLRALPGSVSFISLVGLGIAILLVTSFLPIAVTARRRPLNGMTFRR